MENELKLQIQESERLLMEREREKVSIDRDLPELLLRREQLSLRYTAITTGWISTQQADIEALLAKVSTIDAEIRVLGEQLKLLVYLADLGVRLGAAIAVQTQLEGHIAGREARLEETRRDALQTIGEQTAEFLGDDLDREEGFRGVTDVSVDFEGNFVSVSGKRTFSASSMVYLKNSFHLAFMWASCLKNYFRYPRLVVIDNLEDKGMETERVHNFQRVIVRMSQELNVRHQVIFTTSALAPELEGSPLCVGPYYTPDFKTLKV